LTNEVRRCSIRTIMANRERQEQQKQGGKLLIEEVSEILEAKLTPRETLVVRLSEGLNDGIRHPQKAIGREIGRSRWTVGRIKREALGKLRGDPSIQERLRAYFE